MGPPPAPHPPPATRCISYLTIEAKSDVPADLRGKVGDNLYGCDICQDVCPWNEKFATRTAEADYLPAAAWPTLDEIVRMDEKDFETRFGTTALERAGPAGLKRNARVVLENAR